MINESWLRGLDLNLKEQAGAPPDGARIAMFRL